jgi:G:T/U-mismatch repair DNA glycosylase
MKSDHPFEPFLPEGASKLIIGTIPPPRFCRVPNELYDGDVNFYYGSRDNYFWPLLEDIFQTNFEYKNNDYAIEQRKKFLQNLNIGITDIINSCIHSDNSAKDDQLNEIIHKDLRSLLIKHATIDTLIYTSEFVKRQINSYFKTYHSISQNDSKQQVVKIEGKLYRVKILYSPSPLGLMNLGENGSEKRKNQYREFLLE